MAFDFSFSISQSYNPKNFMPFLITRKFLLEKWYRRKTRVVGQKGVLALKFTFVITGNFYLKSGTFTEVFLFSLAKEEDYKTESVSEEIKYIK